MPPRPQPRALCALALSLCGLALLAGCQQPAGPAPVPAVASGPEAAVLQLRKHVRDNDLAGFARDAVPAADYAALEKAWREGHSRWPLTELPLDEQVEPMLAALGAPGSERTLQQSFKRNFAYQDKDLKDAARSLGLFGVQYVKREGVFTAEERTHYAQVISALSEWAQRAPLADPKRGSVAIPALATAARKTGLTSEQAFQDAGMEASLQRLGPFFAQTKATLADYGLSLDESLDGLRTELLEQKGDQARVGLHYPLAGHQIDTVASLQRREGRWYLDEHLRHAREALDIPPEEGANQPIGEPAPPAPGP